MAKYVFVFDDSETDRQVLQLTLTHAGFDVLKVENGGEVLN